MEQTNKELLLKLKYPVQVGTLPKVEILNFRRIKGKDLRGFNIKNPEMDDLLELAEKLTNQTTSFFDEMDGSDVINVVEKVGNLLEDSP